MQSNTVTWTSRLLYSLTFDLTVMGDSPSLLIKVPNFQNHINNSHFLKKKSCVCCVSVVFVDQMRLMKEKERFVLDTRCHHYLMKSMAKGVTVYSERTVHLTVYMLKTYL